MHGRFGQELGGVLNIVVILFKTETASVMEDGQNVVTRGREFNHETECRGWRQSGQSHLEELMRQHLKWEGEGGCWVSDLFGNAMCKRCRKACEIGLVER